jgi:ABC-2 type transport system ATP-binding protein
MTEKAPAPALQVRGLTKSYQVFRRGSTLRAALASLLHRKTETLTAVDRVEFSLEAGEMVGFLGPNGAGKSTTLKILSGILHPTAGEVLALGRFVPWRDRMQYVRHVGAVFGQKSQLVWDVPPLDAFQMNRSIYDIPAGIFRERLDSLAEMLGIRTIMTQPTRSLSLGERMRCEFALALLHGPSLLFLDEPTIGLDIEAKHRIRSFIRDINGKGVTVILTTHDLQDVEQLARRIILIDKGRIGFDGPIDELRSRFGNHKRVRLQSPDFPAEFSMPGVRVLPGSSADAVELELDLDRCGLPDFLEKIARSCRLDDLNLTDPPLEDAVRGMYRLGPAAAAATGEGPPAKSGAGMAG